MAVNLIALLVVVVLYNPSFGEKLEDLLGGYLPPVTESCEPVQQTRYETSIISQPVPQPITQDTTRTEYAQALITVTMAVTTYMAQTETRQMVVPITRTYEVTATSYTSVVSTNFVQVPPVTRVVTQTRTAASTQVNRRTETRFQSRFETVQRFNTRFSTAYQTQTSVQSFQETSFFTLPGFVSTVIRTQQEFRTQTTRLQDFVSTVTSVQVQTSQAVQFFTPQPVIITNTQRQTRVSTQIQPVVRTQQEVRTAVNTRTQFIRQTSTQFLTRTSNVFSQRVQTVTRTIDRVVTSSQIVPQYITSTRIVNRPNQQFVTQTTVQYVTETQTVRGQNQQIPQIVTMYQNQVQLVTQTVQNAQQSTIERIVTAPCRGQIQQTGYNYNRPSNPLVF